MKILKFALLFCIGGGVYVTLELLYRGYSHGSMFLAGGACFLLIGGLRDLPLIPALLLGTVSVTAVELLTGLTVNRNYTVWDYRDQPGNFLGQICPQFVLIWILLTLVGLYLYRWMDKLLDRLLRLG